MRCHFGPMSLKMVDGATIVKVTQKNIISQLVQVNDKGGVVIGCKYFLRYEIDRKSINTVTGKRKKTTTKTIKTKTTTHNTQHTTHNTQ